VTRRALPRRHQVQQVHALLRDPLVLALGTRQLHLDLEEHGLPRARIYLFKKPRVEVVAPRQRRDAQQARPPDQQQRRNRLVEEPGVAWFGVWG
jgi:hypothetical protein